MVLQQCLDCTCTHIWEQYLMWNYKGNSIIRGCGKTQHEARGRAPCASVSKLLRTASSFMFRLHVQSNNFHFELWKEENVKVFFSYTSNEMNETEPQSNMQTMLRWKNTHILQDFWSIFEYFSITVLNLPKRFEWSFHHFDSQQGTLIVCVAKQAGTGSFLPK